MNEFWIMGSILSFVVFLIFMILPATKKIEVERTFDPEGDYIETITIVWVWVIRALSFLIAIGFLLLYFL